MNQYCRKCGSKLAKILHHLSYDSVTGEQIRWLVYPCPNFKWWAPWTWNHKGIGNPRQY